MKKFPGTFILLVLFAGFLMPGIASAAAKRPPAEKPAEEMKKKDREAPDVRGIELANQQIPPANPVSKKSS